MKKTIQLYGFPSLVAAETVKSFLEQRTGKGTVVAIEVKPSKKGPRSYAKVQFSDSKYAQLIIDLANNSFAKLYFGTSYLKAFVSDMDIIQNPKSFLHELQTVTLCLGCQTSANSFSVLWRASNVTVKFGHGMKKMHFLFSHQCFDYRLQLSYESIWQIVMHSQNPKILHIQLFCAPRIYRKATNFVSSIYSFYMETQDDQWVRTTDFTHMLIGQSSGICLVLPHGLQLPDFRDNFVYYKESDKSLNLESGVPYNNNLSLAPIVHPPRGHQLPYKILFKVCGLVQTGCIPGPKLDKRFFHLVDPQKIDLKYIEHALEKLYFIKECCYEPVDWLVGQYERYIASKEQPKCPSIRLDEGLLYIHRVQVTPSKVYFSGPEVNVSNRVLREFKKYVDNFIRVSFVDEEWEKLYSTDLAPRLAVDTEINRTKVYDRVLSILREGIQIGDKKFEFLAFSSSQLRENSLWMFASIDGISSNSIRRWMGDFRSIRNVAKYAARLGQSFGSSKETLTVGEHEMQQIPNIVTITNGTKYVFSDGIGKISATFADKIADKCGIKGSVPSAFQIRFRGYKGVVAVDTNPYLSKKLFLRPSMLKYQSDNPKLDVLAWTKYQPCFLNRQIITLLSTLGVRDYVFEKKQREAVAQLDEILVDPLKAQEALTLMSPGENTYILKELLKCGYKPDEEPFLSMMLKTFRASKLLDLRTKARIFVPNGQQMMGCLDETGILEYGQVFVQYSSAARRSFLEDRDISCTQDGEFNYLIRGKVVVAKNPCLHPGDVRVLQAVDVQALHHMVDCIVFPSKGRRPHPNECSGSDLDGDIYFVCWDPELIPTKQVPPMSYEPAPTVELDHDVTIDEVTEYFANYIVNDSLGIIANAHTAFADKEPSMAMSEPCLELARLFSIAVDFPKTGVPAEIPSHLRVREYPDFMEKPDKSTYVSTRVIGKLFRQVKDISPQTSSLGGSFTAEMARRCYDEEMEVEGYEEYLDEAFEYKTEYDYKLGNLMDYYGIRTEAEILSGGIMKMSRTFDRRKDAEAIGMAVRSLRNEARSWFKRGGEDSYAMASAWYHVTYHPGYYGLYSVGMKRDHFISFPWCVYDKLVQIKRSRRRRSAAGKNNTVSLLEKRLSRVLNL